MNIFPKKGKTSKKRKKEKLFGASKKRKSENSWKKVTNTQENESKPSSNEIVGYSPSKWVLSLRKKKTSPKTLKLQEAKTAKFTVELVHDCIAEGTYSNPERQKMKREQLHEMKPKRKARWERENQI